MGPLSTIDRILLSLCALLAAFQILYGVEGSSPLATTSYTIGFGILMVASLLLVIMGFEVLANPLVVVISTIIPLSISLGLVAEYYPGYTTWYLALVLSGLTAVALTRFYAPGRAAAFVLIIVHGVSGLLIFCVPVLQSLTGAANPGFILVGIGGAFFGLGGILLSFLRAGRPILSQETILRVLPVLMLLTTAAFTAGLILA